MPLALICEHCKKDFISRKRGSRVIRFCSVNCANESLNPGKIKFWEDKHNEWKNATRESYLEEMKLSFEKFFEKSSDCWIWKGANKGKRLPYGMFTFRLYKNILAHRASWIIYNGEIPKDLLVLHKCDVASCVNPDHLFLGTHLDNERDKMSKGRHKGEKLDPEKVREIKSLFAIDYGDMKIARKFNVSYQTIYSIKKGRTWKDIEI